MFETHYPPYDHEIKTFGDAWCGPEVYEHAKPHLVARYESPGDSDGQTVEIYCTPLPARFYEIRAIGGKNSVGEDVRGFSLGTGSGFEMAALAARTGEAIADGMLDLKDTKP